MAPALLSVQIEAAQFNDKDYPVPPHQRQRLIEPTTTYGVATSGQVLDLVPRASMYPLWCHDAHIDYARWSRDFNVYYTCTPPELPQAVLRLLSCVRPRGAPRPLPGCGLAAPHAEHGHDACCTCTIL